MRSSTATDYIFLPDQLYNTLKFPLLNEHTYIKYLHWGLPNADVLHNIKQATSRHVTLKSSFQYLYEGFNTGPMNYSNYLNISELELWKQIKQIHFERLYISICIRFAYHPLMILQWQCLTLKFTISKPSTKIIMLVDPDPISPALRPFVSRPSDISVKSPVRDTWTSLTN